ncbi:hypothetical protein J6590_068780 [Homalodisca vitripennis]|nr:hypothetical protein J6590_094885 [Homalodisca vitripennis]KAG8335418.1 hypothetical protein J6590_068780 [Homalodisca vitripennis]
MSQTYRFAFSAAFTTKSGMKLDLLAGSGIVSHDPKTEMYYVMGELVSKGKMAQVSNIANITSMCTEGFRLAARPAEGKRTIRLAQLNRQGHLLKDGEVINVTFLGRTFAATRDEAFSYHKSLTMERQLRFIDPDALRPIHSPLYMLKRRRFMAEKDSEVAAEKSRQD